MRRHTKYTFLARIAFLQLAVVRTCMQLSEIAKNRFLEKIDRTPGLGPKGECWHWTGWRDKDGYGGVKIQQRSYRASRIAYILEYGHCPDELLVCHRCDNPPCVNPAHLFSGTAQSNRLDCITKGRARFQRGQQRYNAKLSDETVREIRSLYSTGNYTQHQLSQRFEIGQSQLCAIVRGTSWKHVGQERKSFEDRRIKRGTSHYLARLTDDDVRQIPELYKTKTAVAIASQFKVSCAHVRQILEGRKWKHIGIEKANKRLTPESVKEIRRLYASGLKAKDIAVMFGVTVGTVYHIARGVTWEHVK